ncbi:MAG TPA: hypothetical protein VLM85_16470 [Polyangiaceae bacterium]|nr:hypothetical protein [Polyangiaceae bacterium]
MSDAQRFEVTTTVRRPRTALMLGATALFVLLFVTSHLLRHQFPVLATLTQAPWWVIGPVLAAIQRRPRVDRAEVQASAEGLRVNGKLLPRERLRSALLRREAGRPFVLLRGKRAAFTSVDVAVSSDDEADRLCGALSLDAKSTTAEFRLSRQEVPVRLAVVGLAVAMIVGFAGMVVLVPKILPLVALLGFVALFAVGLPLLLVSRGAKLRVGADGIVLKEGLNRAVFHPHDEIDGVSASGNTVTITRKHGKPMQFHLGEVNNNKKQRVDLELQTQSIAWRLQKAREAYQALAGSAPQAAVMLDRGERTALEWLEQLRRVGEGATATFRSVQLTREQLLRVVESTTAAAKERLAAAVALRAGLTEEEKPRLRVAAERCVMPALGERLVRVADASSDEELAAALEEADRLHGAEL